MSFVNREPISLDSLSAQFPTEHSVESELRRLRAEMDLPGRTEHFISDIHGEYDTFCHVLRTASGTIYRTIEEIYGDSLPDLERWELTMLVSYPEVKIPHELNFSGTEGQWFSTAVRQLIEICRVFCLSYSRSVVVALMSAPHSSTIEELLYGPGCDDASIRNRDHRQAIFDSVIAKDHARALAIAVAELIQKLAGGRLHIIGDIYDRGPGAHQILDDLLDHHDVDIQWGNHDIVWMAAAAGSEACIANVVRICLRYSNLETLEGAYGVSLSPLAALAAAAYGSDDCDRFAPKVLDSQALSCEKLKLMAQMQKAIAIIQFKLEGQVIMRRPQFRMASRLLLDKIDHDRATVRLDGIDYPLLDHNFPTLDPESPFELSSGELSVIEALKLAFQNNEQLQAHIRFLYDHGSMYLVHNGNLLYHGCVAMNDDGTFKAFEVAGERYSGRAFVDRVDGLARQGYFSTDPAQKLYGLDAMWYLWNGEQSPLFGKEKMATFERYFIAEKSTHKEWRNAYYQLRGREDVARTILSEFGANPETGRIINGHVPVQVRNGESPVKANGKLLVIDGGFAAAYQSETGIAGYSLVDHSHGLLLVAHQPFDSTKLAIRKLKQRDLETWLERRNPPTRVADIDEGLRLLEQFSMLQRLLDAYRRKTIQC